MRDEDLAPGARSRHPRHGRITDAISQVLIDERGPMQARGVHARVEALLGEPVRWSSVEATLAGSLKGPAPRLIRVARGRYRVPATAQSSVAGPSDAIDARFAAKAAVSHRWDEAAPARPLR